jgi:hypothetical protein
MQVADAVSDNLSCACDKAHASGIELISPETMEELPNEIDT